LNQGYSFFVDHFSKEPVSVEENETKSFCDGLPLTSNQAVFVYDYRTLTLIYVRGFEILGFDDAEISIIDIFNTAIPEQREACGEISGKALAYVKDHALVPLKNGIVLNYCGQSQQGSHIHLMLEASVFQLDSAGNFVSAFTTVSKLPHLPIPKIVRWNAFGEMSEPLSRYVDEGLIQPNRISNREAEVLVQLGQGNTMAETAEELCISARTVEQHILNMRTRFDCSNVSQLVAFAKDRGLV